MFRVGLLLAAAVLLASCSSPETATSPSTSSTTSAAGPVPVPAPSPPPAPATARYRITFQSTWTPATHPVDYPVSAHFSPLIGGTHNGSAIFWREGALASDGIKDMAERGLTATLSQEVTAAIAGGTAERVITGGGLSSLPAAVSIEFEISQAYPLVTLVSMIAPSPDWFVGVSGLSLFEQGTWTDERVVGLIPWDAGTDSGLTFTSPDLVTTLRQPIAPIVVAPLSPGGQVTPLGTFTFTRIGS